MIKIKISTHLDYTNYDSFRNGDELVIKSGGMVLPLILNNGAMIGKNRGDVFLQFYCHMKAHYGLDTIDNYMANRFEYVNRDKKLFYQIDKYEILYFLNTLLSSEPTICFSDGVNTIQSFMKPIELKVNEFIEKNIIKRIKN